MMDYSRIFSGAILAAGLVGVCLGEVPGLTRTKIIAHGWDLMTATPQEILENAALFDASGVDGVAVLPKGDHEEIVRCLRQYAGHRGLRESLLMSNFVPGKRIAWDDDAGWATFAEQRGVFADIARRGGLKGLMLDNEDYPNVQQWRYDDLKDKMPYEAATTLARKRGMEVGRAIFAKHPEAVLLFFWTYSEHRPYYTNDCDPRLEKVRFGDLWVDFLAGLLDSMPSEAKLVDGDESGYFNDAADNDYYKRAWEQHQGALALVPPELRDKYKSQLSVSSGIYLDMYVNEPGLWYFGNGPDGTRVSKFSANISQGARVATDYLWIYGEKHMIVNWRQDAPHATVAKSERFAKVRNEGRHTWEDVLPGFTRSIRAVTDPVELAKEALAADDAAQRAGQMMKNAWGFWNDEFHQGLSKTACAHWTEKTDLPPGAQGDVLVASNVVKGCYLNGATVLPGKLYAVGGWVKGDGWLNVTWMKEGALTRADRHYTIAFPEPGSGDGWRYGVTTVVAQPGQDQVAVHATVSHRPGRGMVTKFADIRVVEIPWK
ncbi:MAG: hypothetical protein ACOX9C_03800 [Kiritimatiellia bacterium]|jgi:hypothetical protein